MRVPTWLTVMVAAMVIGFGLYRIVLSRRSDEEDAKARARGGLYARPRRTHFLFGVVYLLLGGLLIASLLGYNPFSWGGRSKAPEPAPGDPDRVEVR